MSDTKQYVVVHHMGGEPADPDNACLIREWGPGRALLAAIGKPAARRVLIQETNARAHCSPGVSRFHLSPPHEVDDYWIYCLEELPTVLHHVFPLTEDEWEDEDPA